MRINDALLLPLEALWQQKLRTMLTTLGVVFGAFVLAASLSIGQGVQETIDREARRNEFSRRIDVASKANDEEKVSPEDEVKVEGKMSEERRERIRKSLVERKRLNAPKKVWNELTRERLAKLASIRHVERVIPSLYSNGFVLLGEKSEPAVVFASRTDSETLRQRIVAGRALESPDQKGVVISENLAYRLGLVNDSDVEAAIGRPIRLEFRSEETNQGLGIFLMKSIGRVNRQESQALEKIKAKLPEVLDKLDLTPAEAEAIRQALQGRPVAKPTVYTREFPIVGVIRSATDEERQRTDDPSFGDAYVLVPYETATDLYFDRPGKEQNGIDQAIVLVDNDHHVKEVMKQVAELGLDSRAANELIDRERLIYLLIFGGMTCVAGVALLVSALGIANTMLMSVLERTREIGVMKAVGADNRHLQVMFLVEGAVIGLMGAIVGLFLAWSASFPGDAWVRSMVMRDLKIDLKGSIFVFPAWISLAVLTFTVIVTTIAALYPARHASRIDPVKALRHE